MSRRNSGIADLGFEEAPPPKAPAAEKPVFLNVRVSPKLRREAHLHAVRRDLTLQQLVVSLLTRELDS